MPFILLVRFKLISNILFIWFKHIKFKRLHTEISLLFLPNRLSFLKSKQLSSLRFIQVVHCLFITIEIQIMVAYAVSTWWLVPNCPSESVPNCAISSASTPGLNRPWAQQLSRFTSLPIWLVNMVSHFICIFKIWIVMNKTRFTYTERVRLLPSASSFILSPHHLVRLNREIDSFLTALVCASFNHSSDYVAFYFSVCYLHDAECQDCSFYLSKLLFVTVLFSKYRMNGWMGSQQFQTQVMEMQPFCVNDWNLSIMSLSSKNALYAEDSTSKSLWNDGFFNK